MYRLLTLLRLIGIVISIAAADAVNPSTLVPACYIAAGENGRARAVCFASGVLAVELGVGLVLVLGPGELILDLVPRPSPHTVDWLQLAAGAIMLAAAPVVWHFRDALRRRTAQPRSGRGSGSDGAGSGRASFLVGAGIVFFGMPTNVAYLGALTTIISSDVTVLRQVLLLFIYDAIFILPMGGILAVLFLAPSRSERILGALRDRLERHLAPALVAVLLIAGAFVTVLGITGLAAR